MAVFQKKTFLGPLQDKKTEEKNKLVLKSASYTHTQKISPSKSNTPTSLTRIRTQIFGGIHARFRHYTYVHTRTDIYMFLSALHVCAHIDFLGGIHTHTHVQFFESSHIHVCFFFPQHVIFPERRAVSV